MEVNQKYSNNLKKSIAHCVFDSKPWGHHVNQILVALKMKEIVTLYICVLCYGAYGQKL